MSAITEIGSDMSETMNQVFLNYASPDKEQVRPIFERLKHHGLNVWIDFDRLKPGQNWDFEIKRAIEKSSIVVIFISSSSTERRGYVQREINIALDKQTEKLVDDIYVIPVLLDDNMTVPDRIKHLHCIRTSESGFEEKIADAVQYQLRRLGIESERTQREQDIFWSFQRYKETWDGLPGYEFEMQFPVFKSEKYKSISEIGDFLKGGLLGSLFGYRACKLHPEPDIYNYGQFECQRIDTFDAHCKEPVIVGKIIGLHYSINWYGAGAAHPNTGIETYSFFLDPLVRITALESVFQDGTKDSALSIIQEFCRRTLKENFLAEQAGEPLGEFETQWVDEGTKDWDCFRSFLFKENSLEIIFAPYEVACYAAGVQTVDIPYALIAVRMRKQYVCALGIERFADRSVGIDAGQ